MKAWFVKFWEVIKNAGAWLRKILEDANGNPSSKRIQAFFLIGIAVYIAIKIKDPVITGAFLTAALALQGITAAQR